MSLFSKPQPKTKSEQRKAARAKRARHLARRKAIKDAAKVARMARRRARQNAIARSNAARQRKQGTQARKRGASTGLTAEQRRQLRARAAAADRKGFWG